MKKFFRKFSDFQKIELTIHIFCSSVIIRLFRKEGLYMDKRVCWLWLTNLPGMTSFKITNLLAVFETVENIYYAENYAGVYGLSEFDIKNLQNKSIENVKVIVNRLRNVHAGMLTYDDPRYPDMLRQLNEPPYVLYIKGEIMQWDRLLTISVVGTRKYTEYGGRLCNDISYQLAKSGVTIVSGMARGLDSIAAAAALRAGAKTIAVLGSGIDIVYPPENKNLMDAIVYSGAVITEFPPGTPAYAKNFPYRNRIMSGLSYGTLVIEAPLKSGALITANYAMETGKDVFALPGRVNDIASRGTNSLIKSGAKLVECAEDILEEYNFEAMHLRKPTEDKNEIDELEYAKEPRIEKDKNVKDGENVKKEISQTEPVNNIINVDIDDEIYKNLDEDEKKIIELLIKETKHIDEIVRETEIPMNKINSLLTILEMQNFIKQLPGKMFRLNVQNHRL